MEQTQNDQMFFYLKMTSGEILNYLSRISLLVIKNKSIGADIQPF